MAGLAGPKALVLPVDFADIDKLVGKRGRSAFLEEVARGRDQFLDEWWVHRNLLACCSINVTYFYGGMRTRPR